MGQHLKKRKKKKKEHPTRYAFLLSIDPFNVLSGDTMGERRKGDDSDMTR